MIPCATSTGTDGTYWNSYLRNAVPGGVYGTAKDIAGTTISNIPIIPASLNLPPVSGYFHSFSPTAAAATRASFTASEYLRTNRSTASVERRFPNTSTGRTNCKAANGGINCALSNGYPWSKIASCDYAVSSPISNSPGFHCKGPSVNLTTSGAQSLVIDTSDGPLTF